MKILFKLFILIILSNKGIAMAETTLAESLAAQAKASKADPEKKQVMESAIEKLRKDELGSAAPKVGEILPDYSFISAEGVQTTLYEQQKGKPAIVTFYRGSWCPYCNLQLHALQEKMPEINAAGGTLIAISPELPSNQLTNKEKSNLEFIVLSDKDGAYAEKIKILFTLGDELKNVYQEFGLDLEKANGTSEWKLPLAATFVVDGEGMIVYRFIDVDYKKRAEPSDLVAALKGIK